MHNETIQFKILEVNYAKEIRINFSQRLKSFAISTNKIDIKIYFI